MLRTLIDLFQEIKIVWRSIIYIRVNSNRFGPWACPDSLFCLAAMASVLDFNDRYCQLASFCPGSAPVRCHRATGTPQWGSSDVYLFFNIVCLVGRLLSIPVRFIDLPALTAFHDLPFVCVKTFKQKVYVNVNSLEIENACLCDLLFTSFLSVVCCQYLFVS